ncbi:MAG TPA: peptidoglycan bridge formation glycyltransferase FemA/FemB family protein [Candidatus Woesebacteria bacterium]|jgi:lipid II:glycine glycyltransferase (peptidoglycan interpeptide bridge formation enzyme)|nr:peptidoglycan bridge formation glycyltransferase FemA/FemB family protein [Candidatus Shapirobacteria bacterium]HOR02215.1 peptidoglycan bridge formation glycyltransferase FemA/FemB family protein [Candidatus Woesebacteria bacterium]
MITRQLTDIKDKSKYNSVINHPVQTWEWGEFQQSQGHKIFRFGVFDQKNKIVSAYTVSFHQIPKTKFSVGTVLRGPAVDEAMLQNIKKIATKENAIFVKLEPNVAKSQASMQFPDLVVSPKVAFYPHTFIVDTTQTEAQLMAALHPKTRYNIKVANRHGVDIKEDTTDRGFDIYLKLLRNTTKRQGFYLHTAKYHRDLWQLLKRTDIPHIMLASYQGQVLSAFMIFKLKDRLFYPYGASLDIYRQVMAPTLLMWETIKLAKKLKCRTFDMWGCLGPDAKEGENGFGFHRFKQGFGGQMLEYVGTYDLVINPNLYKLYNLVDKLRWTFLRLKAKVFKK